MSEETIEKVARAMCANLGLDPYDNVGIGYGDDMTPAEYKENITDVGGFVPLVLLHVPQWRLYRRKAAEAIAINAALSEP